ncbi:hypothetical protein [Antarctobacter jejuensis]|uniref:hypothetical protein n=1 Tax=Antarctobacter jejuensis TaxID=1439938 RepID=UPI003FD65952
MKHFFCVICMVVAAAFAGAAASADQPRNDVCAAFFDWQQPYYEAFGAEETEIPFPQEIRWIDTRHGKFVGSDDKLFEYERIKAGFGSGAYAFERANPGAWERITACIAERFQDAPAGVRDAHLRRVAMLRAHGQLMAKNSTLARTDGFGMPMVPPMSEMQQRASSALAYRMQLEIWREDWEARKADGLLVVDVIIADRVLEEFGRVLWPEEVAGWQAEVATMKAARAAEIERFHLAFVGAQPDFIPRNHMRWVTANFYTEPTAYLRNLVLAKMGRDPGAVLEGRLHLNPMCFGHAADLRYCRD